MAAYSGCGERDGGLRHGERRLRTGMARVGGDVQLAGWRVSGRQAPSGWEWQGSQSSEGATELGCPGPALGQMQGEAARRVGEPSGDREEASSGGSWWLPVARPDRCRAVQRASNCVGCQERWAISAGHEPRHVELFLTMAFRMVSSLRMQATKATFFALPAASSLG